MEPENLRYLTKNTGPDVLEAMNEFIKRILGTDDTSVRIFMGWFGVWLVLHEKSCRVNLRLHFHHNSDLAPYVRNDCAVYRFAFKRSLHMCGSVPHGARDHDGGGDQR
jgi:hypothetical protein